LFKWHYSEAGLRLASVVCEPSYNNSGAYWAWKGGGDQLWENYWNNSDRTMVGRCRLTVSKPVLKAPMVSALEATI